jgi:diguanylate cyclase (GGDEF)-like protein
MDREESFILIVDDNPKNLQVLGNILREKDYKTAVAKNGQEAMKVVEKKLPDLILLDIMMPDMDGFEVCRRLKAQEATQNIPVIFISALTHTSEKIKGFKAGGVDYITKPFQDEEVFARVKNHLELKFSREELKLSYQKLQDAYRDLDLAARTDSLTRLSNRRDIIEKMEYEKQRFERNKKPFSLVLSDIDNFKAVNDRYGHDCGDFILVSAANLMRSTVRKQDTVARWGGEEFLLLLPETDLKGGKVVAENIQKELNNNSYAYNEYDLRITMTFGVSSFFPGETIDQCIRKADEALYDGKKSGKNCIVLSEP